MRAILFVCTGNTCRSPLAEAIARQWIRQGNLGGLSENIVVSAGIAARSDGSITGETIAVLKKRGIDHRGSAKPLSREMIEKADLVLGMTDEHIAYARELVGEESEHTKKIVPLDPDGDVTDPIGRGRDAYEQLAKRFEELIPKRLTELIGHEDRRRVGSSR
jgi:protein-tyrosine-phosphatase